jgi:hypothetical protein
MKPIILKTNNTTSFLKYVDKTDLIVINDKNYKGDPTEYLVDADLNPILDLVFVEKSNMYLKKYTTYIHNEIIEALKKYKYIIVQNSYKKEEPNPHIKKSSFFAR